MTSVVNENWERWIIASLSKYLSENITNFALENEDQEENSDKDNRVELLLEGPVITERHNEWHFGYNILLKCSVFKDDRDIHKLPKLTGAVSKLLLPGIEIKKWEVGEEAPDTLGCLSRVEKIRITQLGSPKNKTSKFEALVEAPYEILLKD
jgi:hypothetical protein